MADQPKPQQASRFGFLARKLGPLPVWIWAVIVVALYFLYRWYTTGSFTGAGAATSGTPAGTGTTTIRQTVTDTIRRVARKPAKKTKKPAPKKRKRDGNAPVATGGPVTAPSDGAVRGNPDTKTPAKRKPVATPGPVQARAPGTKTSQTTTTAVGTPSGGVEQVAGGGPGVVYEGPVYGLWTTEQQGVQAFDSSQGQESVNVTAA